MTLLLVGAPSLRAMIQTVRDVPARRLGRIGIYYFGSASGLDADRAHVAVISAHAKAQALRRFGFRVDCRRVERTCLPSPDNTMIGVVYQRPFPPNFEVPLHWKRLDLDTAPVDGTNATAAAWACVRLAVATLPIAPNSTVAVIGSRGNVGSGVVALLEHLGRQSIDLDVGSDLAACARAGTIISCTGVPGIVAKHLMHDGGVLIDAGFTSTVEAPWQSSGDATREAMRTSAVCTPVPGGVGVFQVACIVERALGRSGINCQWTVTDANFVAACVAMDGEHERPLQSCA